MLYAIVAIIAIILDQVVKYLVETHVVLNAVGSDLVRLIPGVIHITNVHNIGGAFNMLQGARWLFIIVCIVFVAVVIFVLARGIVRTPLARWMAIFVLAGAVGNCIDRIICGYVVDMFELEFFRFPVFNLADIFITVGAIVFCLCILLEKPQEAGDAALPEEAAELPEAQPEPARARFSRRERPSYPRQIVADETPIDPNDPFAEWENRSGTESAPAPVPQRVEPIVAPAAESAPDTSDLVWKPDEPPKEEAPAPVWPVLRRLGEREEEPAPEEPEPAADDDVKPFKLHIRPEAKTAPAAQSAEPFRLNLPKEAPRTEPAPVPPVVRPAAAAEAPAVKPAVPAPAKPAEPPAVKPVATEESAESETYNIDDILAEFLDS